MSTTNWPTIGTCGPPRSTVFDDQALVSIRVRAWLRDEGATEIQPPLARLRFGQGPVLLLLAGSEKVHDPLAPGVQKLSDQAPVAAPPERLRAHQAGGRLRERRCQCLLPARSAHAGGVAAKCGDAKTAELVLAGLAREAAAQLDRVSVGDAVFFEYRAEGRLIELRVVARAREAPHIDERADAGCADNRYQLFRRTCAVPDRPDDHRRRMPADPCREPFVDFVHRGDRLGSCPRGSACSGTVERFA